jgi:hypothetical protein
LINRTNIRKSTCTPNSACNAPMPYNCSCPRVNKKETDAQHTGFTMLGVKNFREKGPKITDMIPPRTIDRIRCAQSSPPRRRLWTGKWPLPSSLGRGCSYTVASSTPRETLPINSSLGIAIPIFESPPRASGGSGDGGRGMEREDLKLWPQERSPFHYHGEGVLLFWVPSRRIR